MLGLLGILSTVLAEFTNTECPRTHNLMEMLNEALGFMAMRILSVVC